jgi:hypothetical protein
MSEPAGFRWWHAALILVGANAISALPMLKKAIAGSGDIATTQALTLFRLIQA